MLIYEPLRYWAVHTPDTVCTMSRAQRFSYAEADALTDRIAVVLLSLGAAPGSRVAVVGKNSAEIPLMILGISKAGAVPVPINPRLSPAEVAYIIGDADTQIVLASADTIGLVESMLPTPPSLKHRLVWGDPAGTWVDLRELAAGANEALPVVARRTDADAFQLYTSGTTGRAKGVVMSHDAVAALNFRWDLCGMRLEPGEVFHLSMPTTLGAGMSQALHTLSAGGSLWLESFDPAATVVDLDRGAVAATALAPTMVHMLLRTEGIESRTFDALRWVLYGAAPMPVALLREAIDRFGCDFYQGYGQTEAPAFTMMTPADHRRALAGDGHLLTSVGQAQIGCEVRIMSPDDEEVAPGVVGEVCTRGPFVMSRYWNQPEATARTHMNGWHHSGDLGYRTEDGFIYLVDRLNFTIVSGGLNIYPREVEQVLEQVPGVAMVAVVGMPDEVWGEVVVAAIVRESGATVTIESLQAACEGTVAPYKLPKSWFFVDALPTNANGKIQKNQVKDLLRGA